MWIRQPWAGDVLHVARNMREMDAREILDLRETRDPDLLAATIAAALPRALVAFSMGLDSAGVAAGFVGVWPTESPWLADAVMFATQDFPRMAPGLIRFIRRATIPALLTSGVNRVECRALADHTQSRRAKPMCCAPGAAAIGSLTMCFMKTPKADSVIVDTQSRQVDAAAQAVASQRRAAQGFTNSVTGAANYAPQLGTQVLLGH